MSSLRYLELKYRQNHDPDSPIQRFNMAYKKFLQRKKETIADIAVVAVGLSVDIVRNSDNELALVALKMTNPNFNASQLELYSDMQLQGIINSSKGKYFELLVVDKLNNGETVGNIKLPEGFNASMAESLTQPGWDLKITDSAGNTVDYFQLKATENINYISQTLARYPDIKIITTEEVVGMDEVVIGTDISNNYLTSELNQVLKSESDSVIDDFLEGFNPLLPLCFIVTTQGYKVVAKKTTYEKALTIGKTRTEKSLIISSIAALSYALGAGWYSLPITLGAGALIEELGKYKDLDKFFGQAIPQLQTFNDYRQTKLINDGIL